MLRIFAVVLLALLILGIGTADAQYRSHGYGGYHGFRFNNYYHVPYSYSYHNVGWKWYAAQTYGGTYWKAGYYAQIGGQWHLQGYGPYSGEATPAPAPAPAPTGLTPEETAKLKELLKKLEAK